MSIYKKYIKFLHKEHERKFGGIDNKLENKYIKKIFRTKQ